MKNALTLAAVVVLIVTSSCSFFGTNGGTEDVIVAHFSSLSTVPLEISFPSQGRSFSLAPRASCASRGLDSAAVSFAFAMAGYQRGAIVAGNSADTISGSLNETVISYKVFSTPDAGVTLWGANGHLQNFTTADPNILLEPGTPSGLALSWPNFGSGEDGMLTGPGAFMVSFSPTSSTQLIVEAPPVLPASVSSADEVIMRMYTYNMSFDQSGAIDGSGTPGGSVLVQPHFLVDDGTSTTAYYSGKNLKVNGDENALSGMEYVAFVPASIVGEGFNYLLRPVNGGSVANPVLGDEMEPIPGTTNSSQFKNEPSTWTVNEGWIDLPGNGGIFAMIDTIAGTDRSSAKWQDTALYFRNFFAKYYKAYCFMFNGGAGYASWTIQIIALDPSASTGKAALDLSSGGSLQITYEATGSTLGLSSDGNLVLEGEPALNFTATVK